MIQKLINEINTALNQGLYLVALSSALTLPDVCGKAEYPKEKTTKRYKKWYSAYVNADLPVDHVYALRCSLLHEGNTETKDSDNIHFRLMTNELLQPCGLDFCIKSKVTHKDGGTETQINVYVGYLCTAICKAAKSYYEENKDKFDFLNYSIDDISKGLEGMGFVYDV